MHNHFSLHKIKDPSDLGFDPGMYSTFKFGDYKAAERFGIDLADAFIDYTLKTKTTSNQLVVLSSPYSFIPTATFALKNHFVARLNRWLAEHSWPVCQECKVHRNITYKEDYGNLNAEERLALISKDSFHVDKKFLIGKTLLFLDDIKITGGHERMILKMADEFSLENEIFMIYFAELVNDQIHPKIENYLNYFSVKSVFDLNPIIKTKGFYINTRIVKYILNSEFDSFCIFIEQQEDAFIELLYDMAIGNSYHTMPVYLRNIQFIKEHLHSLELLQNSIKTIDHKLKKWQLI